MKNKIELKKEQNSGITLIALIVTIIALLILAGITITFVFGENGIFTQAQKAAEQTNEAIRREEELYIKGFEDWVDGIVRGDSPVPDEPIPASLDD